jgi:hypothetical protein
MRWGGPGRSPHRAQRRGSESAFDPGQQPYSLGQPRRTDFRRDFVTQLVEDFFGPPQRLGTMSGQAYGPTPPIAGIFSAFDVSEVGELADDQPRRLLGDPEPRGDLRGGRAVGAEGLEQKAVCRPQIVVACKGKAAVQLLEERPGGQQKLDTELPPGRVVNGWHT